MRMIKGVVSAQVPYLTLSVTTLFSLSPGGDLEFDIFSNTSWVITDNINWVSYRSGTSGSGNATVIVRFFDNIGPYREGTLTVTAGTIVRTVTLQQDAGDGS